MGDSLHGWSTDDPQPRPARWTGYGRLQALRLTWRRMSHSGSVTGPGPRGRAPPGPATPADAGYAGLQSGGSAIVLLFM
jgi:hypothetical protein